MTSVKTVLIVDDERQIVEVLERYLADEGFGVQCAYDGLAAVEAVKQGQPDLVLLDLKMPGMNGLEAFRQIRSYGDVPIIMLTSRTDEVDKILGLELGADDYIGKPFSPREVVARVKTVLRRAPADSAQHATSDGTARSRTERAARNAIIRVGGLHLDPDAHEVRVDGREVNLTPTEFRILEVLAENPGRTFTRSQLLDKTKAESLEVFDRTLDRHIANLRHKLERDPAHPQYVLTVFGVGYKMAKSI